MCSSLGKPFVHAVFYGMFSSVYVSLHKHNIMCSSSVRPFVHTFFYGMFFMHGWYVFHAFM